MLLLLDFSNFFPIHERDGLLGFLNVSLGFIPNFSEFNVIDVIWLCNLWNQCNLMLLICILKGCVHYIFASLFCMPKTEHLWKKEKCFLFHFESSFCSWDDNQISSFQGLKCHDVIKCPSMKHQTYFNE